MRQTTVSNVLRNSALAVLASLVMVGTSNAALYKTKWDPLFNPNFTPNPLLGWAGEGTVNLDAACLTLGSGVFTVGDLGCNSVTLTSYRLDLIASYPGTVTATTGTVVAGLAISTIRVDAFGDLDAVELTAGEFNVGALFPSINPTSAFLNFVIDDGFAGPTLRLQDPNCLSASCESSSATSGVNIPKPKWTLVPEPASLALVGLALAGLGLSRRRKA